MRTAPTATIAVPMMITAAAATTIVGVALPWPVSEMTRAVTSAVVRRYANVSPAAYRISSLRGFTWPNVSVAGRQRLGFFEGQCGLPTESVPAPALVTSTSAPVSST